MYATLSLRPLTPSNKSLLGEVKHMMTGRTALESHQTLQIPKPWETWDIKHERFIWCVRPNCHGHCIAVSDLLCFLCLPVSPACCWHSILLSVYLDGCGFSFTLLGPSTAFFPACLFFILISPAPPVFLLLYLILFTWVSPPVLQSLICCVCISVQFWFESLWSTCFVYLLLCCFIEIFSKSPCLLLHLGFSNGEPISWH